MTIVRPVILTNGHKRSDIRLQVPATQRSVTDSGTAWSFVSDAKLVTPGATWTLSAHKPASTLLDLANHAYVIYCLEGSDQLLAVAQEDWAAVAAGGGTICPIAWVDSHHDLTPRLLSTLVPYVWVMTTQEATIYLYNPDGTATGWKVLAADTATSFSGPVRQVGIQVWFANQDDNTISRVNLGGSTAGADLSGNGLDFPQDMLVVGSEVWVANFGTPPGSISRFNLDGTSAGSPITNALIYGLRQLLIVGSEVWAPSYPNPGSTDPSDTIIVRLGFDGTVLGSFSPCATSPEPLDGQLVLGIVGTEVWGAISGGLIPTPARFWPDGELWRMHFDGTSAGLLIRDAAIKEPHGIVVQGGKAWILNRQGGDSGWGGDGDGNVAVYNFDGTPASGSPLVDPDNFTHPGQIESFGAHGWIAQNAAGIAMYSADLSRYRVSCPAGLSGSFGIRDMSPVTMPPLPVVSVVNTTPSGGSSGDGLNTLGLVGTNGSIAVTLDADLVYFPWWLLLVDETDTIVGFAEGGTVCDFDVWKLLGGVTHTYHAVLSTSRTHLASPTAPTNTVIITWPGTPRPLSSTILNDAPSGGGSGDGIVTVSLIGTHGSEGIVTVTVTTNTDIAANGWHLLILDETSTILATVAYGTSLSYTTGGTAATTHVYHALLSTSGTAIVSPAGVTNIVTITWP